MLTLYNKYRECIGENKNTIRHVYKGHSREPENMGFMSSCPLYTGSNCMHYSLMGKNETVLYRQ
jgi:hypothetical protein